MDITIKDLTEEQADTVKAYAYAIKTQNVIGLEFKDREDNNFKIKYGPEFYYDRNYRIKPQPSYLDLHKKSGLKVGDKVKVLRKAENHENGWHNYWVEEMDSYVEKSFEIIEDNDSMGFALKEKNECSYFYFPYFVLEKIKEEWAVKYKGKLSGSDGFYMHNKIFESKNVAEEIFKNSTNLDIEYIKIK